MGHRDVWGLRPGEDQHGGPAAVVLGVARPHPGRSSGQWPRDAVPRLGRLEDFSSDDLAMGKSPEKTMDFPDRHAKKRWMQKWMFNYHGWLPEGHFWESMLGFNLDALWGWDNLITSGGVKYIVLQWLGCFGKHMENYSYDPWGSIAISLAWCYDPALWPRPRPREEAPWSTSTASRSSWCVPVTRVITWSWHQSDWGIRQRFGRM